MNIGNDIFAVDVESRSINFFSKVIYFSLKMLALLMTILILCGVLDVGYVMFKIMVSPPYRIFNLEDVLSTLGSFLIVLIAIEIFLNIIMYFRKDASHIKLVIATALMAISRKVIILDYEHASYWQVFSMASLIIALGVAYWCCKGTERFYSSPKSQTKELKP